MASELEVGVRITADGKGLVGETQAAKQALGGLGDAGHKAGSGLSQAAKQSDALEASTSRLKSGLIAATGAYLSLGAAIGGAKAVMEAAIANERLHNSLTVGLGSLKAAKDEMAFLRQESDRLGLQFSSTAEQYAKLAAASKGTALEGQKTRDIFLSVAKASTVLGLSAADTGGVLTAFQQIISKNKVSTEELLQIAERVPGTFATVARSLNVTGAELSSMLQKGELLAEDLLPSLAAEFEKTYGAQALDAAQGLNAQINRLDNSFTDLKLAVGEAGIINLFSDGVVAATEFIGITTQVIQRLREIAKAVGEIPGLDSVLSVASAATDRGNIIRAITGNNILANVASSGILGQIFGKNAKEEINQTTIALEEAEEVIGRIIRPSTKPAPPKEFLDALKNEAKEREKLAKAAAREAEKAEKAREREAKQAIDSAQKIIDSLKREASEIGKSATQKRLMAAASAAAEAPTRELAQEIMASAQAWAQASEQYERTAQDLRQIAQITESVMTGQEKYAARVKELDRLLAQGLGQETYNRALKQAEEQFLKTGRTGRDALDEISQFAIQAQRNLQNALGDALFDGINGRFDDMVGGFSRAIKQMFAQALAADIWGALFNKRTGNVASLFSALSPSGGAGSGSGGIAQSGLNLFKTGFGSTSFLSGLGRGLPGAAGQFFSGMGMGGSQLAAAQGASALWGTSGYSAATTMGTSFATVAGPLMANAVAVGLGSMIGGDKKLFGMNSAITSTVGAVLGGPVGAIIGGGLNALFGRGPYKFRQEVLEGTASAAGFDGEVTDIYRSKGGLFMGNKHKERVSPNEEAFLELFDSTLQGFASSTRQFATTLGLDATSINNYSKEIKLESEKGKRLTEEAIQQMLVSIGDDFARGVLPQIDALSKSGESAYQTLQRITGEFDVLTSLGAALGNSLAETRAFLRSVSFEQRSAFVEAAGGMDALAAGAQFFADNFLSDAERLQPSIELLNEEMGKLGLSADISKEQFRDLVMSFGKAGGISEEMLLGLFNVQGLFVRVKDGLAALHPELQATADATYDLAAAESLIADKRSALIATYHRERSGLEGVVSRFKDLAANLRSASEALSLGNLSPLTPQQRLDEARRQFNRDRLAANSGDQEALRRLPESGRAFLEASQIFNASSAEFVSDFNFVKQVLESSARVADTEASIAQKQLSQLEASVGKLTNLDKNVDSIETLMGQLVAAVLQGPGNPSITDQQIRDFVNRPGVTVDDVINAATQNNISGSQLAGALNIDPSRVSRETSGASISDQQIKDFYWQNINNPRLIYDTAKEYGITLARVASAAGVRYADIEQWVKQNNLPMFERGTDFVQKGGLAMLHPAEAITPANHMKDMADEIKALRQEVTELRRDQNQQTGALINVAIESQRMNAEMIIRSNQDVARSAAWREQVRAGVR